jgi:tetratricopeptide (TPR) repeat protein
MDIFDSNFDEVIYDYRFVPSDGNIKRKVLTDEERAEMIKQADEVIKNENEEISKLLRAYVRKFKLLTRQYKLMPKLLWKALDLYPDDPAALTQLGCFYALTNDNEKSLECFDKAIKKSSDYPYVWLEKAKLTKDTERKIDCYSEFIMLKPNSIIGYEKRWKHNQHRIFCLGYDFRTSKKLNPGNTPKIKLYIQQSICDFTELIRIEPDNWRYYALRAELFISDDRAHNYIYYINQDAVNDITNMLSVIAEEYICDMLISIKNMLHDIPEEIKKGYSFSIITNLKPDTAAYFYANIIFAEISEEVKAISIYTQIIDKIKESNLLQLYCYDKRAVLYFLRKDYIKTLADLEMINALYPKLKKANKIIHANSVLDDFFSIFFSFLPFSGYINRNNTDYETLIRIYSAALSFLKEFEYEDKYFKNSSIAEISMNRASLYEKTEEFDKALNDYSTAIELCEDESLSGIKKDAYKARIRLYQIRGENDKSFADYLEMSKIGDFDEFDSLLGTVDHVEDYKPPQFVILEEDTE